MRQMKCAEERVEGVMVVYISHEACGKSFIGYMVGLREVGSEVLAVQRCMKSGGEY
jgi:hypothetical protein